MIGLMFQCDGPHRPPGYVGPIVSCGQNQTLLQSRFGFSVDVYIQVYEQKGWGFQKGIHGELLVFCPQCNVGHQDTQRDIEVPLEPIQGHKASSIIQNDYPEVPTTPTPSKVQPPPTKPKNRRKSKSKKGS